MAAARSHGPGDVESGRSVRPRHSACPHCGGAHEDEVHVLWDCLEWDNARGTSLPWLSDAAGAIRRLGPLDVVPPESGYKQVSKTSIFELCRLKTFTSRLWTNPFTRQLLVETGISRLWHGL